MDDERFDGLARACGRGASRRAALAALLGAGLAGVAGAGVSAQAVDCLSPGHGANISVCPYQDADFSGQDLSSSRMVGTNFRGAELVGTDLSSSNARNAIFREADLTCADLRSSTLAGADFRAADLTLAKLKSSGGCNTAAFNAATTFCGTVMCDGSVRNDDCPSGFDPDNACCSNADCPAGDECFVAGGGETVTGTGVPAIQTCSGQPEICDPVVGCGPAGRSAGASSPSRTATTMGRTSASTIPNGSATNSTGRAWTAPPATAATSASAPVATTSSARAASASPVAAARRRRRGPGAGPRTDRCWASPSGGQHDRAGEAASLHATPSRAPRPPDRPCGQDIRLRPRRCRREGDQAGGLPNS